MLSLLHLAIRSLTQMILNLEVTQSKLNWDWWVLMDHAIEIAFISNRIFEIRILSYGLLV